MLLENEIKNVQKMKEKKANKTRYIKINKRTKKIIMKELNERTNLNEVTKVRMIK